jgi:hypothetical protein
MSNAERQRKFQLANPGYDARRKARERASAKRSVAMMKARMRAEALAEQAQTTAATIQTAATKPPLMLPAPVEKIEIPGMTTIEVIDANSAPSPLAMSEQATTPPPAAKPLAA